MISSVLLTDLYQLTMANGYFRLGMHNRQACFHQFFRRNPFGSAYTIAAGLESVLNHLENFELSPSDLDYLSSLTTPNGSRLFDAAFLVYLKNLKISCEIEAVAEGTLVFPREPLFRIRGPILECQLLETALLNIVNFQSLIATKASRCVIAANGREVIEFGLRRAQGPDGGLSASRAAFVGGCKATSNVLAGKLYDIPVKGTQAHSWIMAFEDELTAFRDFAAAMPGIVILLVDTYKTIQGIRHAIEVGLELKSKGQKLLGIRLDSGDFLELSTIARAMLDGAGLFETQIIVSGDLDEYKIASLVAAKAPIDSFGVGTRMITAYDEPALGGVYKLSAIENTDGTWKSCLKISDDREKTTLPGFLQIRRYFRDDKMIGDLIFDDVDNKKPQFENVSIQNSQSDDLLKKVFSKGKRLILPEGLQHTQKRAQDSLAALDVSFLEPKNPPEFSVWVDPLLAQKQSALMLKKDSTQ